MKFLEIYRFKLLKIEGKLDFSWSEKLNLIDVYGNEDRYWNLRLIFFFRMLIVNWGYISNNDCFSISIQLYGENQNFPLYFNIIIFLFLRLRKLWNFYNRLILISTQETFIT